MTDDKTTPQMEFMRVYFGNTNGFFNGVLPTTGEIYALQVTTVTHEYAVLKLIKIKDAP